MSRLFCREAGSGPLLLLLHGFPDTSLLWSAQMEALAANFQVIAPDLRGYGASPRPSGLDAYRMQNLVDDVLELLAERPTFLVGHDWGGILAWILAAQRPDLIRKLVVLNAPHPLAMRRQLWTNPKQLWRSKYVLFFQLPWLPEQVMLRNTRRWLASFHPGDEAYLSEAAAALAQPGAATAAFNYYRAAMRRPDPPLAPIGVPSAFLWGLRDRALGQAVALASATYVQAPLQLHFWPDAGHWTMLDQPERMQRTLVQFLLDR